MLFFVMMKCVIVRSKRYTLSRSGVDALGLPGVLLAGSKSKGLFF